jgi:hypothetical protein
MTPAKPPTPDYSAHIAKATERLAEAIEANSPRNACCWLELLTKLSEASK